MSTISVMG